MTSTKPVSFARKLDDHLLQLRKEVKNKLEQRDKDAQLWQLNTMKLKLHDKRKNDRIRNKTVAAANVIAKYNMHCDVALYSVAPIDGVSESSNVCASIGTGAQFSQMNQISFNSNSVSADGTSTIKAETGAQIATNTSLPSFPLPKLSYPSSLSPSHLIAASLDLDDDEKALADIEQRYLEWKWYQKVIKVQEQSGRDLIGEMNQRFELDAQRQKLIAVIVSSSIFSACPTLMTVTAKDCDNMIRGGRTLSNTTSIIKTMDMQNVKLNSIKHLIFEVERRQLIAELEKALSFPNCKLFSHLDTPLTSTIVSSFADIGCIVSTIRHIRCFDECNRRFTSFAEAREAVIAANNVQKLLGEKKMTDFSRGGKLFRKIALVSVIACVFKSFGQLEEKRRANKIDSLQDSLHALQQKLKQQQLTSQFVSNNDAVSNMNSRINIPRTSMSSNTTSSTSSSLQVVVAASAFSFAPSLPAPATATQSQPWLASNQIDNDDFTNGPGVPVLHLHAMNSTNALNVSASTPLASTTTLSSVPERSSLGSLHVDTN
jgi:hypothetical protein